MKHREMLNVLVVEQQQKQLQYLELLKLQESRQQKQETKQEIVDLTVSKNKEDNLEQKTVLEDETLTIDDTET